MSGEFEAWVDAPRAAIERWLDGRVATSWPPELGRAMGYPLATPGKRIRPLLCLAACEAVTGSWEAALPAAGAIELVHTYSLVHDDLPAMDDADLRRDRPTVHKVWNDAVAVLVGDGLLTEAFVVLATAGYPPDVAVALVRLVAEAAGHNGMVGGQAADIGLGGKIVDIDALTKLHRKKTGALIEASVVAGAIVAGASGTATQALARYGAAVGLAFQLADDLLDAEEDAGEDGPPSFVKLLGEGETRRRAQALTAEAIDAARAAVGHRVENLAAIASFVVNRVH
jgi:geranylgeranyl pyrophosphate synthase